MRPWAGALLLTSVLLAAVFLGCESDSRRAETGKGKAVASESAPAEPDKPDSAAPERVRPKPAKLPASAVSGQRALEHVRALVEFGERPPGSVQHRWTQDYIIRHLRLAFIEIEEVDFAAQTPRGLIAMKNIVGKIAGQTSDIVVLAGHYDTLQGDGFVGANDGGASTALLLELARVLGRSQPNPVEVWVVFFDGEEAFETMSDRDGLYGSRYQAAAWKRAGVLDRVKAVIVVDMIGDRELALRRDFYSTRWLTDLVWQVARQKGYREHFLDEELGILDDHLPFVEAGVPAIDLIDYEYGRGNRYWHTAEDTVDKLSPRSFEIVGDVVLETVARLSQRWPGEPSGGAEGPGDE